MKTDYTGMQQVFLVLYCDNNLALVNDIFSLPGSDFFEFCRIHISKVDAAQIGEVIQNRLQLPSGKFMVLKTVVGSRTPPTMRYRDVPIVSA